MARHHLQNKGYIVKLDCSGASACRQRLWINVSNSPLGVYQPKSISVEWRDGYTGEKRRASWKSGTTSPNSTLLTAGYSDDPQAVLYRLLDNLFVEAGGHR